MLSDAKRLYEDVLRQRPKHFEALHLLGVLACQTGSFSRGEELISQAIKVDRNNAVAYLNRGNALKELRRLDDALGCYNKAITLQSNLVDAHANRGVVLYYLGRLDEALASYDRTITLKPDNAETYNNRGGVLINLGRLNEALVSCERAIAVKPNYAEAYNNLGFILFDLKRLDEALARFQKALALKPEFAKAWFGPGCVLYDLKHFDDAFAGFKKALAFDPDFPGAEGMCLHIKMNLCDWTDFDADCTKLISSVRKGKANVRPFVSLGVPVSADDQLECAKRWVATAYPPGQKIWQGQKYDHDRIRVAYLSADFREHPTSRLIAGMLERHERSRFEIMAISSGPDDNSEIRRRLVNSVEKFIDAKSFDDEQIASLVRSSEIDILVDLMGFAGDARTRVLSRRPAPIQINYLGYPGTMGAPYIDYILADRFVIPEEKRTCYSEKVVYLPNSYLATDSGLTIPDRPQQRSECDLPETGFVFCSFNNSYKITPDVFGVWMRLLRAIGGSILWLFESNDTATRNLRLHAQSHGIDSARLVFARRLPNENHLARLKLADLVLDTLPYNAHTTAVDALWAGVPILTRLGETFAARVAGSLLSSVGLPELITTTPEDYERTAIDLAREPAKLRAIRQKLVDNRLSMPLFNTELFTKHVEAAYAAIYRRHRSGLAPDHIVVPN
jgi:protein O-GlcNAc transferase